MMIMVMMMMKKKTKQNKTKKQRKYKMQNFAQCNNNLKVIHFFLEHFTP